MVSTRILLQLIVHAMLQHAAWLFCDYSVENTDISSKHAGINAFALKFCLHLSRG